MTAVAPGGNGDRLAIAKARADEIRAGLVSLGNTIELIQKAYIERDWLVLGYRSWETYFASEFGDAMPMLTKTQVNEIIVTLRQVGMPSRAISPVVGVSPRTVDNRVESSGLNKHGLVVGRDGRTVTLETHARKLSPELRRIRESHTEVQKLAMANADPSKVTANVPMLNRLRRAFAPLREVTGIAPADAARMMPLSQAKDFAEPELGAWLSAFTEACRLRAESESDASD